MKKVHKKPVAFLYDVKKKRREKMPLGCMRGKRRASIKWASSAKQVFRVYKTLVFFAGMRYNV